MGVRDEEEKKKMQINYIFHPGAPLSFPGTYKIDSLFNYTW